MADSPSSKLSIFPVNRQTDIAQYDEGTEVKVLVLYFFLFGVDFFNELKARATNTDSKKNNNATCNCKVIFQLISMAKRPHFFLNYVLLILFTSPHRLC